MNLATKDIKHNFGRFVLTSAGIGLLLMVVMGMGGIYRGLVEDATTLVQYTLPLSFNLATIPNN